MKDNPNKLGENDQTSTDFLSDQGRFDVTDPDLIADPYAVYDCLRGRALAPSRPWCVADHAI